VFWNADSEVGEKKVEAKTLEVGFMHQIRELMRAATWRKFAGLVVAAFSGIAKILPQRYRTGQSRN
jgi:hypothetical protein